MALVSSLFLFKEASAQYDQSSYSVIGVGTPSWGGFSHNAAMGGFGVTHNGRYFVNSINPALLASNYEAVFQLGTSIDVRNFRQGEESYSVTTGGLKDFGMSLPIKFAKWNLGLSLTPYSAVSYSFTSRNEGGGPDGTTPVVEVNGAGGLDEFAVTNAFKLKNFQLGIKASLIFGSIQKEDRFFLDGITDTGFGNSVVNLTKSFNGAALTIGGLYKLPVGENKTLNIGGFYNPQVSIRQNRLIVLENQAGAGVVFSQDTVVNDRSEKRTIDLPQKLGFGISYTNGSKFTIGVDYQSQAWSDYRNQNGEAENSYGQAYKAVLGGEFVPDVTSVKLLSLTRVRFGIHFEQTPFVINNETINDLGISLGGSFPLNAFWGRAHLNVGATIGQRGRQSDTLVRENYFKINLGFSVQDLTWFARQKFN